MGPCVLCEDILVEILRRLRRRPLLRFKCVSKQWSNLISNRVTPVKKHAAILLQERGTSGFHCSGIVLRLDDNGGASVDHYIPIKLNYLSSIHDSCNDLILLRCFLWEGFDSKTIYFVYNPINDYSVQVVPPDNILPCGAKLVFDGNHYKLVYFSFSNSSLSVVFFVFSLEDEKWKRKELKSPIGHLAFVEPYLSNNNAPFFKGAMHWFMSNSILIYHLQDEFCKAIELPIVKAGERSIWQVEERLHYCQVSSCEINIWVLHMEEQNYIPSRQFFKWQHKHRGFLGPPNSMARAPYYFTPLVFNEDFEMLYIAFEEGVISYSPWTRRQKLAYLYLEKKDSVFLINSPSSPFVYEREPTKFFPYTIPQTTQI